MLLNRDVFVVDPAQTTIPNDGVAKVGAPETPEQIKVLRHELTSFVCEGEYERGLDKIMTSYLGSLDKPSQPAVWVSGFYGSGKSHLVRVLEYLWLDHDFPDGATARGITNLPPAINAHFRELDTAGRRRGGRWSAAGTLGAGAGDSVRLALLQIVFTAAGLPSQYGPAKFVIWLKQNGYFESFRQEIEGRGRNLSHELNNMFVSPLITQALMAAVPDFAANAQEARTAIIAQYQAKAADISDEEFLDTLRDVLELQSATPGQIPCTLLVLDEVQQFIGDDQDRALAVQNIVEACSGRFGSALLFVATGQAAMIASPQLQKLQGRFTCTVQLSESDVERVIRQVVLRKNQAQVQPLNEVLNNASGEIDRHLIGTKIAPRHEDRLDLVPDYPLLPVRRRFWERVLRGVDPSGTIGQLRTQLRIVHEATRAVSGQPLGTVIAGDSIYDQVKPNMLQTGELLSEMNLMIEELKDGTPEGELKARLCATIFLIGKLATDGPLAAGIEPKSDVLADLLVQDLPKGSSQLRHQIPGLLEELVERGTLLKVGDEYRLQTRESSEWDRDFNSRRMTISAAETRIADDRATALRNAIGKVLGQVSLSHGQSRIPRKVAPHYRLDPPPAADGVPVWIRDGWSAREQDVVSDAQIAGTGSPVVFVYLPRRDHDALKDALAGVAAAQETLDARGHPTTDEGREARAAMESRRNEQNGKVASIIAAVLSGAKVFQGGGNEVLESSNLGGNIQQAAEHSLARLYPEFSTADHERWSTVFDRTAAGNTDALSVVGHQGNVENNGVCRAIRDFISGSGRQGTEIRAHFTGAPYGWPLDAISAGTLVLLANGILTASSKGQPVTHRELNKTSIWQTNFRLEQVVVTASHKIAVRAFLTSIGQQVKSGEELGAVPLLLNRLEDLAQEAGGDAPLPERPSVDEIREMRSLSTNECFMAVHDRRGELERSFNEWQSRRDEIALRLPQWQKLQRLAVHARETEVASHLQEQIDAIVANRALLVEPDPVRPLLDQVTSALRSEVQRLRTGYEEARTCGVAGLTGSDDWGRLSPDQQADVLADVALQAGFDFAIGTDEDLLKSLDAMPLRNWRDRTDALETRLSGARRQIASLLEPKSESVRPPSANLRSEDDVDAYLTGLRETIMGHIRDGRPVIIS